MKVAEVCGRLSDPIWRGYLKRSKKRTKENVRKKNKKKH